MIVNQWLLFFTEASEKNINPIALDAVLLPMKVSIFKLVYLQFTSNLEKMKFHLGNNSPSNQILLI